MNSLVPDEVVMDNEQPKHILIVDDDVTSLDIISFVFQRSGHIVDRCASGESAIEYVKAILPDLILIDLLMPGVDGIATVKAIREMGMKEVPIVAFTAVEDEELHEKARNTGCQAVVTKPLPAHKLLELVSDALTGKLKQE